MATVTERTFTFSEADSNQEMLDAIEDAARSVVEEGWDLTKAKVVLTLSRPFEAR